MSKAGSAERPFTMWVVKMDFQNVGNYKFLHVWNLVLTNEVQYNRGELCWFISREEF